MKRFLATCIALAALVSVAPSHAAPGSASATYVANGVFRVSRSAGGQSVGVGGFQFTPTGDPSSIKITDAAGPDVEFEACQELPGTDGEVPGTCGDGDDVSQPFCSKTGNVTLPAAFVANTTLTVFISTVPDLYGAGCENSGTTGTVTLNWA